LLSSDYSQIKNKGIFIASLVKIMAVYVKGPEPDRWHWSKNCKQYPQVAIRTRNTRPTSDLCDDCLDIEQKELQKTIAT
jgi:hypothetical protein